MKTPNAIAGSLHPVVVLRALRAEKARCLRHERSSKRMNLFYAQIAWRFRASGVQVALDVLKQHNDKLTDAAP